MHSFSALFIFIVRKIKDKKAMRPDGVSVKVWNMLGSLGIACLTKFFDKVIVKGKIVET